MELEASVALDKECKLLAVVDSALVKVQSRNAMQDGLETVIGDPQAGTKRW